MPPLVIGTVVALVSLLALSVLRARRRGRVASRDASSPIGTPAGYRTGHHGRRGAGDVVSGDAPGLGRPTEVDPHDPWRPREEGSGRPVAEDIPPTEESPDRCTGDLAEEAELAERLLALEASSLLPETAELTRYGEPVETPRWSARVLRALAARHGLGVRPVTEVHDDALTAAVIAADAMMYLTGSEQLDHVGAHSTGAARTFARVLFRAAGGDVRSAPSMRLSGPPGGLMETDAHEIARYVDWALTLVGPDRAPQVLRIAADDLGRDTAGGRFVAFAALLEETAERLTTIGRL